MNQTVLLNTTVKLDGVEIRNTEFQGVDMTILPCVLLTEGVHTGESPLGGAVFYPGSVLQANVHPWGDVPIVVNHPQNEEGNMISCKDPEVIAKAMIGRVYNTAYEDGKLKGELWLETAKNTVLIDNVKEGKEVEVSTGLLAKVQMENGNWNGEAYMAKVVNMFPDHLAILPDAKGACSWEDGCGIRNQTVIKNADKSLYEKMDGIREALKVEIGEHHPYVVDVYEEYVIFEICRDDMGCKLYKRYYHFEDEEVKFTGEAKEVVLSKTYKEITNNEKEATSTMAVKNTESCCKERVAALIENQDNPYVEEDREWLETMNQAQFEKIELTAHKQPEQSTKDSTSDEGGDEDGGKEANVNNQEESTPKRIGLADLDEDTQMMVNAWKKEHDTKKAALITNIMKNEKCGFTIEQLQAKPMEELEILHNMAALPKEKNQEENGFSFVGQQGAFSVINAADIPTLALPTMNVEEQKQ